MNKHDDKATSRTFGLSRRDLLKGGAAAVGAAWLPVAPVFAASSRCPYPPDFPAFLRVYRQRFKNWSGAIDVDDVWTCAPRSAAEIVALCNWAKGVGYRIRPRGMMHNWSPLTLPADHDCQALPLILVDTTRHLTGVSINKAASPAQITAQTGIQMEPLLEAMEREGLGWTNTPAPGDLTLGGVLAIDGHGSSIPASNEQRMEGQTFGSVSNNVLSLTAVVWDEQSDQYQLRTFRRDEHDCAAFLVHLGRAFIVEATLQASENQRLRCESYVQISADTLFDEQGGHNSVEDFLDQSGRMEVIWFPHTRKPWLKVWSVTPRKPWFSRKVRSPFNYPFSDNLPLLASDTIEALQKGETALTPVWGALQYSLVTAGLPLTFSKDIWGWSKDLLLYVKPHTLRVTANGYAILTRRRDVQRVIADFTREFEAQVGRYQDQGLYPMNGPVEIRVTGLDSREEVDMDNAVEPLLSAVRPCPDQPEFDCAVWLDILTFPGSEASNRFYSEMEDWIFSHFSGDYAHTRVEWSKGWGYTAQAPWDDAVKLEATVPHSIDRGQPADQNFAEARRILNHYDPYRLFSSPLLDKLI